MRQTILLLSLVGITFLVSSCNTIKGMGQDIKKGGEAIEESADKNK